MFKQLYFAILVGGLCASGVEGSALPARDLQSARDQPYTNAEAFARGLPPLPPRAVTPSRSWTAIKRQASPVLEDVLLTFDDAQFNQLGGLLAGTYKGINLGCIWNNCGYNNIAASNGRWGGYSSPNMMTFNYRSPPRLSSATAGGRLRLRSLACAQGAGATTQLNAVGYSGGVVVYTQPIACTQNNVVPAPGPYSPATLNAFPLLPLVDEM